MIGRAPRRGKPRGRTHGQQSADKERAEPPAAGMPGRQVHPQKGRRHEAAKCLCRQPSIV